MSAIFDARPDLASDDLELPEPTRRAPAAPGKRTLTMGFAAREDRAVPQTAAVADTAAPASKSMDDAFGLHLGQAPGVREQRPAPGLGSERPELERAFGVSLAGVVLHEGPEAHGATERRGVRAFALGDDVAVPDTIPGAERRFILAHEVAHVVQQRGGTGGTGDIEVAANAAAAAFVAGRPVPAQPAAPRALAAFQGVAEPAPVTEVAEAQEGAEALPAGPIGNQRATPDSWGGLQRIRNAAGRAETAEERKAQLERATPNLKRGGSSPLFISPQGPVLNTEWVEPATGRRLRISYVEKIFHILDAALFDINKATTPAEFDSIWAVYLLDAPRPAPWQAQRELEKLRRSRAPLQPCTVDSPEYWQPTAITLPPSSPLGLATVHLYNLTRFDEDPDGSLRVAMMLPAIYAAARKTPATAEAIRPPAEASTSGSVGEPRAAAGKRRPVPTLYLPRSKEPHLHLYQLFAGQRMLVHDPAEPRGHTKQLRNWDAAMKPGGSFGISTTIWQQAKDALDILGKKYPVPYLGAYRPDWSWTKLRVEMQVDHIVELQLVAPSARAAADNIVNYELLDATANRSSGAALKEAIKKERQTLFAETGDRAYLDKPLTFERVVLGSSGQPGERWTAQQVHDGEHVRALRSLVIPTPLAGF